MSLQLTDTTTLPDMRIHGRPPSCAPGDWWRTLFATLWITGARIDAVLRMRWQDMDSETGRKLSRAASTKQRADTRPDIRAAMAAPGEGWRGDLGSCHETMLSGRYTANSSGSRNRPKMPTGAV